MQSKAKTSCRQLADKLRQVCDRLAASPRKAITSGKQPVRKSLTKGRQTGFGRIERRNGGESGSESSPVFHGTPYL